MWNDGRSGIFCLSEVPKRFLSKGDIECAADRNLPYRVRFLSICRFYDTIGSIGTNPSPLTVSVNFVHRKSRLKNLS